jgi:hypothetical protein
MMQEQVLGYWVMMATRGGELQRWGHPNTPDNAFVAENDALAFAAKVASASTCDSVYVMTVFGNGSLSMRTICRPARDPSGPVDDAGTIRRW